mgnify:CR=1 FL=1
MKRLALFAAENRDDILSHPLALLEGAERFGVGDVADHDQEDADHRPSADPLAGCICVIGAEHKARFRGLLARLVQPYHGM